MQFDFTYNDISLWLHNFLSINLQLEAYDANCGEIVITSPTKGIRKLLPQEYITHKHTFFIDGFDKTSVTISLLGLYENDELFCQLLTRYVNYCLTANVIEQIPYNMLCIHFDRIGLTRNMSIHSLQIGHNGVIITFASKPKLYEHLRILQMLLRAGYKEIRIIPDDMPYSGYWFSDETLEYTLITAKHPADMRLQTSIRVMDWLGLGGILHEAKDFFHPIFPMTRISYKYGEVTIIIPVTIAEPEINTLTLERNCARLQEETKGVMMELIDCLRTSEKDLL